MDVKLIAHQLRIRLKDTRDIVTAFWQPTLVIVGILVTYIGLVATTYALTRSVGWGPAATVAGAGAAALGLLAPKFRVEDRK